MKLFMPAIIVLGFVVLAGLALGGEPGMQEDFEKAFYKELGERDPSAALQLYEAIIGNPQAGREVASKACLRRGFCLEKLGREADALAAFQKVVDEFGDQAEQKIEAQKALARLKEKSAPPQAPAGGETPKSDALARMDEKVPGASRCTLPDAVKEFFTRLKDPAAWTTILFDDPMYDATYFQGAMIDVPAGSTWRQIFDRAARERGLAWSLIDGGICFGPKARVAARSHEQRIRALLKKPISLDFMDTPLKDVFSFVRMASGVNFVVLNKLPMSEDEMMVQLKVDEIPIESAVNLIANLKGFQIRVMHEVVCVGDKEQLYRLESLKWFGDSLSPSEEEDLPPAEAAILLALRGRQITLDFSETPLSAVLDFLREVGGMNLVVGPGASKIAAEATVTLAVNEISLESALRLILMMHGLDYRSENGVLLIDARLPAPAVRVDDASTPDWRIKEALRRERVSLGFRDASLGDVADFLKANRGLNVVVDPAVLEEFRKEGKTVNISLEDIGLGKALQILLKFLELDYKVMNGALVIGKKSDK